MTEQTPLPVELAGPAETLAEVDRLIAVGQTEMKHDIKGWQQNEQARKDHMSLLEYRDDIANGALSNTSPQVFQGLQVEIEAAIAERETFMKRNIRSHMNDVQGRDEYTQLLDLRRRIAERLSK